MLSVMITLLAETKENLQEIAEVRFTVRD